MGDDLVHQQRPQPLGQVVAHTRKHDETPSRHRLCRRPTTIQLDERIVLAMKHKGGNRQLAQAPRTVW
jgi:hypothetical protein